MCRSMVDIQSATAEIRRGIKKRKKIDRRKLQGKNIMAPLLHRAAIMTNHIYVHSAFDNLQIYGIADTCCMVVY